MAVRSSSTSSAAAGACRCRPALKSPRNHFQITRAARTTITTPIAFSAPDSSQVGSSDLKTISGIPMAISAAACPSPHQAPRRAAPRASPPSAATSEVTATRWSGSEACRRPSTNAIPSATSSGAPSNRPVSRVSSSSTGRNRNSKSTAAKAASIAAFAEPDDREVGEARLEAEPRLGSAPAPCRARRPSLRAPARRIRRRGTRRLHGRRARTGPARVRRGSAEPARRARGSRDCGRPSRGRSREGARPDRPRSAQPRPGVFAS